MVNFLAVNNIAAALEDNAITECQRWQAVMTAFPTVAATLFICKKITHYPTNSRTYYQDRLHDDTVR